MERDSIKIKHNRYLDDKRCQINQLNDRIEVIDSLISNNKYDFTYNKIVRKRRPEHLIYSSIQSLPVRKSPSL